MKIVQNAPWSETSGSLATNKFQISNNPVIFEILRSKIYQDPIGSICREIASNARDAHREVGTPDKPIQVHLPTSLDPNFRIRDFGPGISPDRVDSVFRIYGESSKRLDNNQLGGFGLGAKTPYSYTNAWSVNTYIDKIKRVYHCYLDDTLSGDMVLMSETKTKEPNGTEIVVPVTSSIDYNRFRDAMLKWTAFWPVKPQFVGVNFDKPEQLPEEFRRYKNISKPNISAEKYDLYISPNKSYSYNQWLGRGIFAVIDGLVYDIDLYQSKLNNTYKNPDIALHLKFEIGELTFTAGRESLQYNDSTILAIRKRFEEVWPQIVNNLQTHVDALESYREALQFIDAMGLSYSNFTWRGFELQRNFRLEDLCPDEDLAKQLKIYCYRSTYKGISRAQSTGNFSVGYEDFAMFFNDVFKKTMLPRYLEDHFFKESSSRSFYYLSWAHDYDGERSLNFIPEKFKQAFQLQELSKLTLPEPKLEEKEERVLIRSTPTHFRAMQIRMSNRAVCDYVIEPFLFDRTIPCLYLMMEEEGKKHIKLGLKWFDGGDLSSINQFLRTYSDHSNFNLAIFTGEKQKKQAEKDGAVTLIDLNQEMKKILDKEVKKHALSLEDLFFYDERCQFGYSRFDHLKSLFYDGAGEIVPFPELGELWEYFLYSNEVESLIEEHKLLLYWLRKFYSSEGLTKTPKLQEYAEKDWSQYLLLDSLGYIPDNRRELLRQQLRNYVKSLSSSTANIE